MVFGLNPLDILLLGRGDKKCGKKSNDVNEDVTTIKECNETMRYETIGSSQ